MLQDCSTGDLLEMFWNMFENEEFGDRLLYYIEFLEVATISPPARERHFFEQKYNF